MNRPGHASSGATRSGAVIAVIPARFASKRFPGKLLADRTGKPLIQHVHERVSAARCINRILIAADDRRIIEAVRHFGGDAVMTRADHANGTSRIAEVAVGLDCEFIVNVQGDEPELDPALIDLAVQHLRERSECPIGTLASPFASDEDPRDPNIVKVVLDSNGRALYFSRSLIPFDRDGSGTALPLKHVGLYVYRREFLPRYVALPPTPLEQAEQLEQLRVLEHGFPIAVVVAQAGHHGIDTPQQYEQFVQRQRDAASLARR